MIPTRCLAVALVAAVAVPALAAAGPVHRYTLVVGANFGGDDRPRLRYAVSDAERVARVLVELGGVEPANEIVLKDPKVRDFVEALGRLGRRLDEGRKAAASDGGRTEVLFYYSGHADEKGLLLGDDRVSYQSLRDRLDDVPADVRIAVLDACASGAFTRLKGGRARPPFLVDASNTRGHAFLTSSAATEAAQESDRIGASYFTHYLVSGFRGAADTSGDGLVTLNEAYQFAFTETLGRTVDTRGGAQHPSYDINLTGAGDVVMTDVRQTTATLVLEEDLEGRVFIRTPRQQLVAELYKPKGRRIELGLEPGAYEVRVEAERAAMSTRTELGDGATVVLASNQLRPATVEPTRSRGAGDVPQFGLAGRSRFSMTIGGWGSHGEVLRNVFGSAFDIVGGVQYARFLREDLAVTFGMQAYGAEADIGILGGFATPLAVRWNPRRGELASQRVKPYLSIGLVPATGIESGHYALGFQAGAGVDLHLSPSVSIGLGGNYNGFPFNGSEPGHDDFRGPEISVSLGWIFGRPMPARP